jgi:hypothetical protein
MSAGLKEVLSINTDFVTNRDQTIEEGYKDDSKHPKILKAIETFFPDMKSKKFEDNDEMKVDDIINLVACQLFVALNKDWKGEGSDLSDAEAMKDKVSLSYNAEIVRNDIIEWIIGRQRDDIAADLEYTNDACDVAINAFHTAKEFLEFIILAKKHTRLGDLNKEAKDEVNTKRRLLKLYAGLKTTYKTVTLPANVNINSGSIDALTYKVKDKKDKNKQKEEKWIWCEKDPDPDTNGTTLDTFRVYSRIHKSLSPIDFEITLPIGPSNQEERNRAIANTLIDKIQEITEIEGNRLLELLDLGAPITEMVRHTFSLIRNNNIRKLDRDADGNSNVPVIVKESMSYIKAGYYLDEDKEIKKIEPKSNKALEN